MNPQNRSKLLLELQSHIYGQQFGRLTVIGSREAIHKGLDRSYRVTLAECKCHCWRILFVYPNSLRRGSTKSCGCLKRERLATGNKTHGLSKHALYSTWCSMIDRCLHPTKPKDIRNYRNRGIKVCERWLDFRNFITDMGERPYGTMLERKDNDGNYEPRNCKWATPTEQCANTRRTRTVYVDGIAMTARDASLLFGFNKHACSIRVADTGLTHQQVVDGWYKRFES